MEGGRGAKLEDGEESSCESIPKSNFCETVARFRSANFHICELLLDNGGREEDETVKCVVQRQVFAFHCFTTRRASEKKPSSWCYLP